MYIILIIEVCTLCNNNNNNNEYRYIPENRFALLSNARSIRSLSRSPNDPRNFMALFAAELSQQIALYCIATIAR